METRTSVSLKNSARVIPKVWHIISSLSMGGIRFFRYHVEIVDCGIPDNLERRYVVHPRSSRKEVIYSNTSNNFASPLIPYYVNNISTNYFTIGVKRRKINIVNTNYLILSNSISENGLSMRKNWELENSSQGETDVENSFDSKMGGRFNMDIAEKIYEIV